MNSSSVIFCGFLSVVLVVFLTINHVSCGDETKWEVRETRSTQEELFMEAGYQVPVVIPVNIKNADVYVCLHGAEPATANYTWKRLGWPSLPEGTKAEGNRLYFMHSTSDLNGQYVCIIRTENGTSVASFYRKIQDCALRRILNWVSTVLALWTNPEFYTVNSKDSCMLKSTKV